MPPTNGEDRAWELLLDQLKQMRAALDALTIEVRTLHSERAGEVRALEVRMESLERSSRNLFLKYDDLNHWREGHVRAHGLDPQHRPDTWVASMLTLAWHHPGRTAAIGSLSLMLILPESRMWLLAKIPPWIWKAVGL